MTPQGTTDPEEAEPLQNVTVLAEDIDECSRCGAEFFGEHECATASSLPEAVKDVCWKATPYGETEDGDIAAYLVPKGALHRLVGAAQGAGISAALRVTPTGNDRPLPDVRARLPPNRVERGRFSLSRPLAHTGNARPRGESEMTENDNDGFGKCPVEGCDGWVSNGTCQACGEDFTPKNPIPGTDHFYDWCWCDPRIEIVHADA